ncbi:phage portal protein [Nocardiopsis alba]|uniref:phage portal protein n=1 Tax=Nocardiopsis alba TaxID=53437 RepID=UPI003827B799
MNPEHALEEGLTLRTRHLDAVQRVRDGMRGKHARSYMPKTHESEFQTLRQRAVGNWLPLVVTAISQNLFGEGYKRPSDAESLSCWEHWTRNGLDSRQSMVYRAALTYGQSYVVVLPGSPSPVIRVHSPLVMTVVQDDPDAEWPDYAIRRVRKAQRAGIDGVVWEIIDDTTVWTLFAPDGATEAAEFELLNYADHGFDVCPVSVFRNAWDDDPDVCFTALGEVEPLIPIQERINDTTLGLLIAQQYSAFRQKWASGIDIPRGSDGKPVETFEAAVNRIWMTASKDVRFGEFSQTDLGGYLESMDSAIKHMSAIAQVPPHYLLGGMVNISAEALAAAEAGLTRKVGERKTIFGEAWGRVMRLCAYLSGDYEAAEDREARFIWRDSEARSLAATADALGKLRQMLDVPAEALWEMIPGVTPFQRAEWLRMRAEDSKTDAAAVAAALVSGEDRGLPFGSVPPGNEARAEAA